MRNLLSQLLALGPELALFILTAPLLRATGALALTTTAVASSDLDLSSLGRVALGGDYDSVSIYSYEGQSEDEDSALSTQSLLTQLPDGTFDTLATSDAYITAMCPFMADSVLEGIILAGNFTSIGGVEAQSAALYNPTTGTFSELDGLDGAVYAVLCDAEMSTVYFGGSFTAPGAMNAMSWVTNWTDLPFAGFNGPVNTIAKNSKGHVIFGGQFDGLGNTSASGSSALLNSQVIPLGSGTISASGTINLTGFDDPSNIICQTGEDGPGTTWLLANDTAGYWEGVYDFGYNPTKLRLYNTDYDGRGTKSWQFENLNSGGVPNMVYTDSTGTNQSCSSVCPLPLKNSTAHGYTDFYFVPAVGMSEFRINILDWYGAGGGLAGIEMFQDDLYSFAVNEFNEPKCDNISTASISTHHPADLWHRVANNGTSSSDWLAAYLTNSSELSSSTNVIFEPNIPQAGNYSILMYTPGCEPSDTCATRGTVNVTGLVASGGPAISALVTQTNYYDKFDQIYYGPVDVTSDSFKPKVTLSPIAGQTLPITVVAQRVRFDIVTSTDSGGLNGLYAFDPTDITVSDDFSTSYIDSANAKLDANAMINAVTAYGDDLYVAGQFTGDGVSNIMVIDTEAAALTAGGLNDAVNTMYLTGSDLYIAGNFTDTVNSSTAGLNAVAVYDVSSKTWKALGDGVDGGVTSIVPVDLNITSGNLESCITLTGSFTSVYATDGHDAFNVSGFAVWVPSKGAWLNNIADATADLTGDLITTTKIPGSSSLLYAGLVSSQQYAISDAVELVGSGTPSLEPLGIDLSTNSTSSMRKRAIDLSNEYDGVYTGLFYEEDGLNITVLGGKFSATASSGSTVYSLVLINDTDSQTVKGLSGIDAGSIIAAVATYDGVLYAGGSVTGTIDGSSITGVVAYDLTSGKAMSPQPPSLTGSDVVVNAIAIQPSSSDVYFGGSFDDAGSLSCSTLCYYDASTKQWNTPGSGIGGTITTMFWSSSTNLFLAGDLKVNGDKTTMATYDSKKQTFTAYTGAAGLPGPIAALNPVSSSYDEFWAAGTATKNGSAYLSHYSSGVWTGVGGLGSKTTIRDLQIMGLTSDHSSTSLVSSNEVLMLVGNIHIPDFGNASAALFNGTDFTPFLLTDKADGSAGSVGTIFVSNPQNLLSASSSHHLAVGLVVLIGLAIALGLICLIIAAGILVERHRRRSQGYVPMSSVAKNGAFSRVPPETLFGGMTEKSGAPKV